ncbi:hypothetical protein PV11_02898 [Exophiala sideris]|uniref:Bacteriophage T5 Orf172 DNA-binding domain-containing protein n=1 Tax=Exophiala sideris TaxID=1016849 RepID=A0A0D1XGN6_9EURO|nr:hypothetical protein PV11_02898 [Exophiala sideris]
MLSSQLYMVDVALVCVVIIWGLFTWTAWIAPLIGLLRPPVEYKGTLFFDVPVHGKGSQCLGFAGGKKKCGNSLSKNSDRATVLRMALYSTDPTHASFPAILHEYVTNCLCYHHNKPNIIVAMFAQWEAELVRFAAASDGSPKRAVLHSVPGAFPSEFMEDESSRMVDVGSYAFTTPTHDATPASTKRSKSKSIASGAWAFETYKSEEQYLLHRVISQSLTTSESGKGYIYVLSRNDDPDYVKIGYTEATSEKRLSEWKKSCKSDYILIHSSDEAPFARRLEKIIHADLDAVRYRESFCKHNKAGCNHRHNEWFKMTATKARRVVDHWVGWMIEILPYDRNILKAECVRWIFDKVDNIPDHLSAENERKKLFLHNSNGEVWARLPHVSKRSIDIAVTPADSALEHAEPAIPQSRKIVPRDLSDGRSTNPSIVDGTASGSPSTRGLAKGGSERPKQTRRILFFAEADMEQRPAPDTPCVSVGENNFPSPDDGYFPPIDTGLVNANDVQSTPSKSSFRKNPSARRKTSSTISPGRTLSSREIQAADRLSYKASNPRPITRSGRQIFKAGDGSVEHVPDGGTESEHIDATEPECLEEIHNVKRSANRLCTPERPSTTPKSRQSPARGSLDALEGKTTQGKARETRETRHKLPSPQQDSTPEAVGLVSDDFSSGSDEPFPQTPADNTFVLRTNKRVSLAEVAGIPARPSPSPHQVLNVKKRSATKKTRGASSADAVTTVDVYGSELSVHIRRNGRVASAPVIRTSPDIKDRGDEGHSKSKKKGGTKRDRLAT